MASLVLPDRLTHAQAPACVQALTKALQQGTGSLIADASALRHFDSSALAVLLEARRTAQARGCGFAVDGLPERLRELAVLYGVADLLLPTAA